MFGHSWNLSTEEELSMGTTKFDVSVTLQRDALRVDAHDVEAVGACVQINQ